MKGRRVILIAAACLVTGVVCVLVWPGEKEPEYQGKKLSEWLLCAYSNLAPTGASTQGGDQYDFDTFANPKAQEAARAVRSIGKEAIPCLVSWIQYDPSSWRLRVCRSVAKLPVSSKKKRFLQRIVGSKAADGSVLACIGFWILGPEGRSAVPELGLTMNKMKDTNARYTIMTTLMRMGEVGFPPLRQVLTNETHPDHVVAGLNLEFVHHLGTNARVAVPTIIECLGCTNQGVAMTAAKVLGQLAIEPATVIPALTNALRSTNDFLRASAAESLQGFGKQGAIAVPALLGALDDPHPAVRYAATKALREIAPEAIPPGDERWKANYRPKR
jgi:hypothetical protein